MIKKLKFRESCIKKNHCVVFETIVKSVKISTIAHLKGVKITTESHSTIGFSVSENLYDILISKH